MLDEVPPAQLAAILNDCPVVKSSSRTPAPAYSGGAPEEDVGRHHKRLTATRIHDHYVQSDGESHMDITYLEVVDMSLFI